ncbi:Gfo/Idh/MocA family protein [Cellulomonas fimi]|uniref:Gfo/Idh/MocA family oxidoreductase n=1 Tax=Cellulomonas fimi TaxID=1708 RepID=A0A7Y0LWD3_CELFI|nr:Gfo/Idh/MocA family oxidoreductase [Cellulomonas fimi]NMR19101.1 Gfo/Idh/MocA family oxidoreductase [Cellulomonas fimi]
MRVGIVGLGDIATKAYLPVLTATLGVVPVLVTRDPARLAATADRYRVRDRFRSVDEALVAGLDAAFVHTPSQTHPAIVTTLLGHGVPVLVDKPIATDLASAREVVETATRLGVSLAVGFNRRHAPAIRELADWPDRDVVVLHKHRQLALGSARAMVFDDFIHVVDTLRFLVPRADGALEPDDVEVSVRTADDGSCRRVAVRFTGAGRLAIGVMSWTAGTAHEGLDVIGDGRRRQVVDLADVVDFDGGEVVRRRDGWAPATRLRGFEAMCDAFLTAVRDGHHLDATDALRTHELCEHVVRHVEQHAGARGTGGTGGTDRTGGTGGTDGMDGTDGTSCR